MAKELSAKPSSRSRLPRIWNGLIWMGFCTLVGSGLLLAWRLPPGSRGGRGLSALGWDRHEWGDFHSWMSYVFLALMIVHLALHWRWFWQIAARKRIWPLVIGLGGGVAIIVLLVLLPVRGGAHHGDATHPRSGHRGSGAF